MKTLIALLAIDAALTMTLIVAARRNPALRRRLVDSFRLLVGDAYVNVVPAVYTTSNEDYMDDDGPDYERDERDGFKPEDSEEEDNEEANYRNN